MDITASEERERPEYLSDFVPAVHRQFLEKALGNRDKELTPGMKNKNWLNQKHIVSSMVTSFEASSGLHYKMFLYVIDPTEATESIYTVVEHRGV